MAINGGSIVKQFRVWRWSNEIYVSIYVPRLKCIYFKAFKYVLTLKSAWHKMCLEAKNETKAKSNLRVD